MSEVLNEVVGERLRQNVLWGPQNHTPEWWYGILGEEFGEVGRAMIEWHFGGKPYKDIRKELIQVAAVAVAWAESLDRNEARDNPQ